MSAETFEPMGEDQLADIANGALGALTHGALNPEGRVDEITRRLKTLEPQLGKQSDRQLAKSVKLSPWRVSQHRTSLGIPAHVRAPLDRDTIVCGYVAQHPDCGLLDIAAATRIPEMKLREVLPRLVRNGRLTAQPGERRAVRGPLPLIYRAVVV